MSELETMVGVLKAAGETTRLRLLALLAEGELSVKDLTEILGQSQPRVSRHLKLLADADLVERNAEGAWAYFALKESGSAVELARWLIAQLTPNDPGRARDLERLRNLRQAQQAQAAAYFAKVAESWDLLRSLHVPESAVEHAIVEVVERRKIDTLLDLGTGTGRMLELLSGHYRRGLGVDSSREMIAVARAKLIAAGITNAQVRLGDIGDLDPAIGSADLIIIHQVLHYFDDPGRMLAQARRLLKPEGEMLIIDFSPHDLEFLRAEHAHRRLGLSEQQMAGWARAAGLKVETIKQFPNDSDPQGLTVGLWRLVEDAHERSETA
jgi:ubiquinone/menaquinone biosynthesis C-methylase UbiE